MLEPISRVTGLGNYRCDNKLSFQLEMLDSRSNHSSNSSTKAFLTKTKESSHFNSKQLRKQSEEELYKTMILRVKSQNTYDYVRNNTCKSQQFQNTNLQYNNYSKNQLKQCYSSQLKITNINQKPQNNQYISKQLLKCRSNKKTAKNYFQQINQTRYQSIFLSQKLKQRTKKNFISEDNQQQITFNVIGNKRISKSTRQQDKDVLRSSDQAQEEQNTWNIKPYL